MFETSIERVNRGRRPGSWRYWPLAVGLHALVLLTVLVSQVWTVSAVADPPEFATFRVSLPPPSPPAGGRKAVSKPDRPAPTAAPTAPTQPEVVPDTVEPAADSQDTVSTDEVADDFDGPEGGGGEGPFAGPGPGDEPGTDTEAPDLTIPVELSNDIVPPVVLRRVEPQYTELARVAKRQGAVIVQATVNREGQVVDVRVLRSLGYGLDEAAVKAVRQWQFKPAERFGRPAAVLFNLTVNFHLQ